MTARAIPATRREDHPLHALFAPRSVAIVGASDDVLNKRGVVLANLLADRFPGALHPVNPRLTEISGVPCHKNVASIPGPVDVAVVLIGPNGIPALMEECRAKGVKIVVAVGDIVAPDHPDKEGWLAALRKQIDAGGPRIVGPVCVGVRSPVNGVSLTISSGAAASPRAGNVGLVTQSGGIFAAVLDRSFQMGTAFSHLVSSGGEFDLNACDYLEYMLLDPATEAVALHMEKIVDPPRLFALAEQARAIDKPIVVLKTGRTEAGQGAALCHSGAIAGDDAIVDAAFRRHGMVRVDDIDDLHQTAAFLARYRVDPDKGAAAASQSGGFAVLAGDRLSAAGVPMATLSPATVARLREEAELDRIANPVDSGGGMPTRAASRPIPPGATREEILRHVSRSPFRTRACFDAFDADPGIGAIVYAETMFMAQAQTTDLWIDFAHASKKPFLVCWQAGARTAPVLADLRANGVATFDSMASAGAALGALYARGRLMRAPRPDPVVPVAMPLIAWPAGGGLVDHGAARRLLAAHGVSLVEERVVADADAAVAAAAALGYPVVMKGMAEGVAHKSDLGLVLLGLGDADAVRRGFATLASHASRPAVLVQRMVRGGAELIVGVKRDPGLGPAVILGWGGTMVEAMRPPVVEMAPLGVAIAEAMVDALDPKGILAGYRTGRALDRTGLVRLLVAVGNLAWQQRERIAAIDLNPVIVGADGVAAVDLVVAAA